MIKPALLDKKIEKPHSWSDIPHGEWIGELIQSRLDEWCPKLFGYHMLKIGGLSAELDSRFCNIKHQVNLDNKNSLRNITSELPKLPFLEKSIDACVLAHQIDYSSDPHQLLREVDRVLINDGYIILTGFNPMSAIGIASLFPWRKNNLPWSGRMFTPHRIKDWLSVLNFEVVYSDCFALAPLTHYRTIWTWFENLGGDSVKPISGIYFIVARKRTYPLRPIKSAWKKKPKLAPISVAQTHQSRTDSK